MPGGQRVELLFRHVMPPRVCGEHNYHLPGRQKSVFETAPRRVVNQSKAFSVGAQSAAAQLATRTEAKADLLYLKLLARRNMGIGPTSPPERWIADEPSQGD